MSAAAHELGVAALGRALRARELSSVEAATHLLGRLSAHERLGVALAVDPERAMAQAQAADIRLAAGDAGPAGPGRLLTHWRTGALAHRRTGAPSRRSSGNGQSATLRDL